MRVKVCTLEDLRRIELTFEQLNEDPRLLFSGEIDEVMMDRMLAPSSWSLYDGERPVACFGMLWRWSGLGEVWALYAREALQRPKELLRVTRMKLDWCQNAFSIRRFQTSVREDFDAAHRWVMRLGFIPEGRMPSYGIHGSTHILYGKVK